jgi:phage-related protein
VGIGREVADAYIDVHGDLSSFRRDLQGADAAMREAAFEKADLFSKAWADRIESDVKGKWGSIVDAMYSEKQIDWDRMFGEFNPRSLEDARDKVAAFLEEMSNTLHEFKDNEGNVIDVGFKLDDEEARKMLARMDEVIAGMQKQEDHQRRLIQLQQDLTEMQDRNARVMKVRDEAEQRSRTQLQQDLIQMQDQYERIMKVRSEAMDEAIAQNKAWARTFEGMFKNNKAAAMAEDFKAMTRAMNDADWSKFAKGFDTLSDASRRVREINALMHEQGRITDENAQRVQTSIDAYIQAENDKSKAMRDALAETQRLKKAQDDYNSSLSGMARNFHFAELEGHFRRLAAAMDSNDWSAFAKGAKDMDQFKDNVMHAATEMHRLGRMGDGELSLIGRRMVDVAANAAKFNVSFRDAGDAADDADSKFAKLRGTFGRLAGIFGKLSALTKGLREHLGGFAGLNVFGDMIEGGLNFIHNLDRIAVSASIATLKMVTLGATAISALAGTVMIAQDLLDTAGGLVVALPAFFFGAAISVGVLSAALKDTETVLADLKPAFAKLQDDISSDFWKQAAGPIREAVKALMPIIDNPNGTSTARSLGILVGKLATAFKNIPADKITAMFDRMNRAIDILGNAMAPLVRAFTTLGDVGSKYFERFSTWIVKLSDQFDKFIQKSAANGNLDKWINNAIKGFKNLARIVDGTMGIFNGLQSAAEAAGTKGLGSLADKFQRLAAIIQSPPVQNLLTDYFKAALGFTRKLSDAIGKLGPAFQSFTPTAVAAIDNIGDAVSKLIGYIGDIFANPRVQKGVRDFTEGIRIAVEHLEPAIKPFGDSLGHVLELLGKIIVSVADIVTVFEVTLGPVLDRISAQLGTLVKPLSDTAQNFIRQMGPPLDALNKTVITPIVTIVREKLLPAVNRFFEKLGPILTKIIEDLGPVFVKIVEQMPKAIDLITEILPLIAKLIEILTPVVIAAVADGVEKLGNAMETLANGLKILNGELPLDLNIDIFRSINPDKVKADAEKSRQKIAENLDPKNAGNVGWAKVLSDLFWGSPPDVFWSDVWNMIGPTDEGIANLKKDFENVKAKIVGDWDALWSGKADRQFADMLIQWFPGQADFINGVTGWIDDVFTGKWFGEAKTNIETMWNDTWKEGGNVDQLEATVNGWLNTNVFEPFGRAMDSIGKLIPESFKSDVSEWGLGPAVVNWINNSIMPEIGKGFSEGWKNIAEGRWGTSVEGAAKWEGFWKDWNEWWSDDGTVGDINKTVNDFFENRIFKPLRETWDNAWKAVSDWLSSGGGGESSNRSDTNGQDFWNSFWGGFGGMWGDVKSANADISKTVNDWLDTNVWKPIGDWIKNIDWGKIGDDLWNGFIAGLTGKDVNAWEKIGSGFTGWVEDMKNFFGIHSPSTLMFGFAGDIVAGFLNGFGGFAADVGTKWEEIKTAVSTKFEEIKTALATKWEEFKTGWNDFWGGLGTTIGTKWEEFKTTVGTKWEELRSGIATKWEEFKTGWGEFWGGLGSTIGTKWEEIKTTVGTKWEELRSGLATKWEEFKTGWDTFWGGFGSTVGTKWEEIKTTVGTKWEELTTGLGTKWEEFKTGWSTFWGDTGTELGKRWEEFKTTVGGKSDEIGKGIEGFAGDVKKNWDGFWGDVGGTLGKKWEEFKGTVGTKAGEIKTGVSTFGNDVKRNWDGFWGGVGNTLTNKWGEFTGTTERKTGEMKGDVNAMAGNVKTDWQNMLAYMSSKITSGFQTFVNVVNTRVGEIVSWVSGMPGRLVGAIGDLGGLLWSQGWSVMTSFLNGLQSTWGQVTDFVGGIAQWIADNKGPLSYDRVLLEPAGKAIMEGLDNGLKSRMDPLLNTLQTITAAVTDTVTADLSKSVMYSTGRDAAQGLADGLKANRASVHTALGNLGAFTMPSSQITVGGSFAGSAVGRPTTEVTPGRSVTIAEGAIKIETPTQSPELVAAKVIDKFVNYSTF